MSIQSNSFVAQHHATSIGNAVELLTPTNSITLDSQTTVAGNSNAKQAIADLNQSVTMLASVVNSASENIQSVASEFERLDQRIASRNSQAVAPLFGGDKPWELPR